MDADEALISLLGLLCAKKRKENAKRKARKFWVCPLLSQRKERTGIFTGDLTETSMGHFKSDFFESTGLPWIIFQPLLEKLKPLISKEDTIFRESIQPGARLEATLRLITTGMKLREIEIITRISKQSLSGLIGVVCDAIFEVLKDDYYKVPKSSEDWKAIADDFGKKWDFPYCVGALGGRYLDFKLPSSSKESTDRVGKEDFFLIGVANANYEFISLEMESVKSKQDGEKSVWEVSSFCSRMEEGTLDLPADERLEGNNSSLPFVFVGEESFPLKPYLMKPYSNRKKQSDEQRVYSHRISRALRSWENAFGLLMTKFRIFQSDIRFKLSTVEKIVLASLVLHNYLCKEHPDIYLTEENLDTEYTRNIMRSQWQEMKPLDKMYPRTSDNASSVRDNFTAYFNNEGALSGENKCINEEDESL